MFESLFAEDIENMLTVMHNSGLVMKHLPYFLHDFDHFCTDKYPYDSILTFDIAEQWIHNTNSDSRRHMSNRAQTMKHLGRYQCSIGKQAYIPEYHISHSRSEEPHLFTEKQLVEFFEKVDTAISNTKKFPHNSSIYPVLFRMIYCCGLRSSEACKLRIDDIDLTNGIFNIYHSKGFKDRTVVMSDDLRELCVRFHKYYSVILPDRTYFFQPSHQVEHYESFHVTKVFDRILQKTSFSDTTEKKFTTHGLRHLFAVQNIRKCIENSEDFNNWSQYLCRYMGHKNISETMYYLHITSQLFPVYNPKLKELEKGIGVVYVEE